MARRKKDTEKLDTVVESASTENISSNEVEGKAAEEAKAAKAPKLKKYVAARAAQFHPFQRIYIPTGSPGVPMEEDSWLQCQIDAGLVKELP